MMDAIKTLVVWIGLALILLAILEFGARMIERPRAIDELDTLTAALATNTPPPTTLPSWSGDGKCKSDPPPADPARYWPDRPSPLAEGLQQIPVGSYYSIDSLMEQTWSRGAFQPAAPTGTLAVFGSSTIVSGGLACVEFTIPSQLQRLLSAEVPAPLRDRLGGSPRVDNLGQSAFVAYNQFLLLINMLRNGYRPQVVVLIQGYNDALQQVLTASPHFNYGAYAIGASGLYSLRYALRDSLLSRSALVRLLTGETPRMNNMIVEGADHKAAVFTGSLGEVLTSDAMARRAAAVAKDLLSQATVLSHMAKDYGFALYVINEPTIFYKKSLADNERAIVKNAHDKAPAAAQAIKLTQDALHEAFQSGPANVHYRDLRDCFGASTEGVYIDIVHRTARGNELIAACLMREFAR